MQETQDRLLAGIEEAAKKLAECSEGTEVITQLSASFRQLGFAAGRASGRSFSMLDYLKRLSYQEKRKMPRKQKKAFIKENGRTAYHLWQRIRPLPQFTPWRVPIPEFKLEYIQPPEFPKPKLPERDLLFLKDLWPQEYGWKAMSERIWQGYKPVIWIPDIS